MDNKKICVLVTDIDGVMTDGRKYISSTGEESKSIAMKDLDALTTLKEIGIKIVAITGENDLFSHKVESFVEWDAFFHGCKNKWEQLKQWLDENEMVAENVCYIGDGKYDLPVMDKVGVSLCPADAIEPVVESVTHRLNRVGGTGCLDEALRWIELINKEE